MINKIKDVVIIYFSATGNTLFVSEEIKKYIDRKSFNVQLISAEDIEVIKAMDFENKILGLGFPCYAFDYPHKVLDTALQAIKSPLSVMPAFIYSTYCIGDGVSKKNMIRKLRKKNFITVKVNGFKCPSSGFYTVKSGKEKGIKRLLINRITSFDKEIIEKIEKFSKEIINALKRASMKEVKIFKPKVITLLPLCFARWNEKRIFTGFDIDNEKCSMCRRCLDNCPVDNFTFNDNQVKFKNDTDCLRCMRCINNCPKDAISLGKQTVGKLRYNSKTRERLLEER